jgi:hypothetical protein
VSNPEQLAESIAHWNQLAVEADERAAWDEVHVGSGVASRNKAQNYRDAARALELEAATGKPHCACCHKPTGAPGRNP